MTTQVCSKPHSLRKTYLQNFLFLVCLIGLYHFMFSPYGYNPTDDGFNFAYSRRLLEGEIPHRDFISIRPVGSPLFHALYLPFGGDYTYLLSRFVVTAQIIVFSWLWIQIFRKKLQILLSPIQQIGLLAIASLCNLPCPIAAWYTIDGLFFGTLGVALCAFFPRLRFWGYILIGYAVLCKQNFVFFAIGAPFLIGDYKKLWAWIGEALPGVLYLGFLAANHGLSDYFLQVSSHVHFLDVATATYIHRQFLLPLFAGLILWILIEREPKKYAVFLNGLALTVIFLCSIAVYLNKYMSPSLCTLGLSIGILLGACFSRIKDTQLIKWGLLLVLLNWAGAISISGPFPHHSWGTLLLFVFLAAQSKLSFEENNFLKIGMIVSFLVGGALLSSGRMYYLGREKPKEQLTRRLDGVYPGANGIWTNENTYNFLSDLKVAVKKVEGATYSILPDCAGYWVSAPQRNPLPMDWVQRMEIFHPQLFERVQKAILSQRAKGTKFIVQKIMANSLAWDSFPDPISITFDDPDYAMNEFVHYRFKEERDPKYGGFFGLTRYVIDHFKKIDETQYFEIYE
jgi:hypothetical protein